MEAEKISNGVLDAAYQVDQTLRRLNMKFCLIGGIAVGRWGEPRTTVDVDVTVLTEFGKEAPAVDQLLATFHSRIENARAFALEHRILLLQTESKVGIDLSLGALPYEADMIDRATDWEIGGHRKIRCCSAEDLIIQKAFADRPRDWLDVETVLIRMGSELDFDLIERELGVLCELKSDAGIVERLDALKARVSK